MFLPGVKRPMCFRLKKYIYFCEITTNFEWLLDLAKLYDFFVSSDIFFFSDLHWKELAIFFLYRMSSSFRDLIKRLEVFGEPLVWKGPLPFFF